MRQPTKCEQLPEKCFFIKILDDEAIIFTENGHNPICMVIPKKLTMNYCQGAYSNANHVDEENRQVKIAHIHVIHTNIHIIYIVIHVDHC